MSVVEETNVNIFGLIFYLPIISIKFVLIVYGAFDLYAMHIAMLKYLF